MAKQGLIGQQGLWPLRVDSSGVWRWMHGRFIRRQTRALQPRRGSPGQEVAPQVCVGVHRVRGPQLAASSSPTVGPELACK